MKIAFQSIMENINTATATGQLIFHIFGALAEFERNLIKERTLAGLAAGRQEGRPKSPLADSKKIALAKTMHKDKTIPIKDILANLGIKKSTFYKYIK